MVYIRQQTKQTSPGQLSQRKLEMATLQGELILLLLLIDAFLITCTFAVELANVLTKQSDALRDIERSNTEM
jgi:hypothetical protein